MKEINIRLKSVIVNANPCKLKVGMINGFTLTAIELWNDKKFIEKRIREQLDYKDELMLRYSRREIDIDRHKILSDSAHFIAEMFAERLKELRNA